MLLKELLSLDAPSGCEDEVREFILKNISADEIMVDSIGNIIAHKKGAGKKVMLAAHMDEVGMIISSVTSEGFLKFKTVGGIETTVLVSKKILIGKDKIPGIISYKAAHLQNRKDELNMLKIKDLHIDIGAKNKEDAESKVSVGDYAVFDSEYTEFGDNLIKAKALDDRVGCAILIELLKEETNLDLYVVFTTQEEVGLRGAAIAANRIQPEYALVVEGTTCSDVYGTKEHEVVTNIGSGVAVTVMDNAAVADREMFDLIVNTAKEKNIAYQLKRTTMGGTDAGSIQRSCFGVKTAVIAVPCRYIHSAVSVMSKKDFDSAFSLAKEFIKKLEEK